MAQDEKIMAIDTEYREAVEQYAKSGKDMLFHNKGPQHALVIMKNIFENASSTIRIAAGGLCLNEVVDSEEYKNAAKMFLDKKGTTLKIMVTEFPADDIETGCLWHMIAESDAYKEGRVIVKDGEGRSFQKKDVESEKLSPVHFCTADGHMYRLENDIVQRAAVCNFGDVETTSNLESSFDKAFNSINKEVDLSQYQSL